MPPVPSCIPDRPAVELVMTIEPPSPVDHRLAVTLGWPRRKPGPGRLRQCRDGGDGLAGSGRVVVDERAYG
jgi:hypothetical protein